MSDIFEELFGFKGIDPFASLHQTCRVVLPDLEPHPLKQWHREHKWCWCPACAQRNPRGARNAIDIGFRHCGHCAALLWRALDSNALAFPLPDEYPWFMRMNNGPRGTGWYRKKSIEILYGRH